jgi:hypothetical protein
MTAQKYRAVYILYPRGVQTGGPEALHQLGAALRELGTPAFMVPFANTVSRGRVPEYEHYGIPEVEKVIDLPDNAVVAPEVRYFEQARYRKVERFCWWLSIDNSILFRSMRRLISPSPGGCKENMRLAAHRVIVPFEAAIRPLAFRLRVQHLTQSAYAWSFLHCQTGVLPSMLSDYTALPKGSVHHMPFRDPRQISFNPAKGGRLVQQVIDSNAVDAHWVRIENMTRVDVVHTLQSSAIYLDLGHHPGKDRLPREAGASGAVTIVARTGAGAFSLDFPLPYDHKIIVDNSIAASTSVALNAILADLTHQWDRQATFRRRIELEKRIFMKEVRRIFVEGQLGSDVELEREL